MAANTVRWKVEADTRGAVVDLEKVRKKLRDVDGAAKKTKQGALDAGEGFESLKLLTNGLSGELGGLTNDLGDVGEGLVRMAGSVGGLTTALGAGAVAAGVLGTGIISMALDAENAIATLEELGSIEPATPEQKKAVDQWAASTEALEIAWAQLKLELGEGVLPILSQLVDGMSDVISVTIMAKDAIETLGRSIIGVMSLGASEAFLKISSAIESIIAPGAGTVTTLKNMGDEFQNLIEDGKELGNVYADGGVVSLIAWQNKRAAEAAKKASEEQRALAKAERERADALTLQNKLVETNIDLHSDLESESDRLRRKYSEIIEEQQAIADAAEEGSVTQISALNNVQAATERLDRELARIETRKAHEEQAKQAEEHAKALDQVAEAANDAAADAERAAAAFEAMIAGASPFEKVWMSAFNNFSEGAIKAAEIVGSVITGVADNMVSVLEGLSERAEEAVAKHEERLEELRGQREELMEETEEQAERRKELAAEVADAIKRRDKEGIVSAREALKAHKKSAKDERKADRETLDAKIKNQKKLRKKAKKEALNLFKLQRGARLAEAGIQSALNVVGFSAIPPLGVGPIAGPPLAVALGAATVGAILAQPPPQFPDGGIVRAQALADHVPIMAQEGEAVLSRRGVRELGSEGIDRLNSGRGAGGERPVLLQWRNDLYDVTMRDSLKDPRSVISSIATSATGRSGHYKRR